ncbi:MAG TPA: protein kinase, partial [Stenomitos sp.]
MPNAIANRYEIRSSLGEGGMGKVWSVRDTVTDRDLALKAVHGTGESALQQLKHEFWIMTRLRHPHTVEVYDYGALEDGTPYFTMEIVAGRGLDEALPLPASEVREILAGLCRALSFIHAQGYVHGDLKPENVRLTPDGQVKLMDFGLMERAGRAGGPIRGTLLYLAPEVARGGRVDQRADLYSLGAVAYHLLAGVPPFQAESAIDLIKRHLEAPVPALPDVDPELAAIVTRLMAKDPLHRFQSAGEVLEALGYDAEEVGTTLLSPSFIGREESLERFEALLQEGGGLVLVEGPEGTGKTRLSQEFHLVAQLAEKATAAVRAPEHAVPYAPIVEALRALLPLARSLCPQVLEAHGPVLSRLLPELGVEAPEALEPQQEKMRLQGAVTDVLGAIARTKGLVLLVDDAQWLDEPSRELCDHLLRNTRQAALWLVLVSGTLSAEPAERFEVENLAPGEATRMIASMLGTEKLAPEFLEPVLEVSAGNPRYLHDLLHHLVESGLLLKQDGAWQTEGGFNLAALPRDLHGILGQKLDALGPEATAVARVVAVVGGATRLGLLTTIPDLPRDEALFQAIGELEAEGVLELGPQGYEFTQHQFTSLVAGALGEAELRGLHGHIAEALLPQLEAQPSDVALLNAVASHLLAGDEPARAVPFALRAGERNIELFANQAARRYFEAGLRFLDDGDPGCRLRYLVGLGDVARRMGDQKEALAAMDEALPLAERMADPVLVSHILTSIGKIHQTAAAYDPAKEALKRAAEVAEAAHAPRELLRALTTLGRITFFGGDVPGAVEVFSRALEVSREAQIPLFLAESLAFLGYLFASDPRRQAEGLAYLQESLLLKQGLGDKIGLNDTTMLLGNAYLALGRYREANECFMHCQQINAEIGQTDELIFGHLNLAIVAFEMGDVPEALRLAELAREGAVATNSRYAEGMAVTLAGIARLYLGQLAAGMAEVDRGLALAREMNNRYLEVTVAVYRSEALLQLGRLSEAMEYAKAALALTEETGVREIVPQQQVLLGLAQLQSGEREAARLTLISARTAADASNARGISAKALWAL